MTFTDPDCKYPNIKVQVIGKTEADAILEISMALREAGVSEDETAQFTTEARSGVHSFARVAMDWVSVS
jgi:hypothetical protein